MTARDVEQEIEGLEDSIVDAFCCHHPLATKSEARDLLKEYTRVLTRRVTKRNGGVMGDDNLAQEQCSECEKYDGEVRCSDLEIAAQTLGVSFQCPHCRHEWSIDFDLVEFEREEVKEAPMPKQQRYAVLGSIYVRDIVANEVLGIGDAVNLLNAYNDVAVWADSALRVMGTGNRYAEADTHVGLKTALAHLAEIRND